MRPVKVKPPSMFWKKRPNGRPCCVISRFSRATSSSNGTVSLASTTRFDWRDTGASPGIARPWPFDCRMPATGERLMRNVFSTPLSTATTRRAFTPSSS